jgi:PKD repeat protein
VKPYLLLTYCVLAVSLLMVSPVFAQYHYVAAGEYFIDTDPGVGSGTPLNAADGTFDNITEQLTKNITGLSIGLHTLNVRVRDNNGNWGPVFTTVIRKDPAVTARPMNITQGEVFWDTDPGEGNGVALIAFDGNFNDALEKISSGAFSPPLTTGVHSLNIRVKGHDATWSQVFTTVVRVDAAITARDIRIAAGEVFFDTDPGEGAATPLLAFDGNFNNALEQVKSGTLNAPNSTGLHTLNIRVRGPDGTWGPVFTTVTRVDPLPVAKNVKITSGEIFYDSDPGEGLGTPLLAFDGNFNNALETVSSSNTGASLSIGLHTLNIRVAGNDGAWSPLFTTVIVADTALPVPDIHIAAGEFWWDENLAGAVPLISFDGTFNDAFETVINNAALVPPSAGFHKMNIHVMGLDGNWSNTFSTIVSVEQPITAGSFQITMGEFWWDNDSGNAIALISFDGTFNDAMESVVNNGQLFPPSAGFHKLNIRVKGFDGNYSNTFSTIISVEQPINANDIKIITAQYWWDTDSTNAQNMLALDGSLNNALEQLTASPNTILTGSGFHLLNIRVRGIDNSWSNIMKSLVFIDPCISTPVVSVAPSTPQQICTGDSVLLSAVPNNLVSYVWIRGTETVGSGPTYSASEPGFYKVIGYDSNGCPGQSAYVQVDTTSANSVTITPLSATTFCDGSNVTLVASGGFSQYTWSNGANTQSINVTTSGNYSVTGTSGAGCTAASLPTTVTVNPNPSIPAITIGGPTEFCIGESVLLTSSAANSYLWNDGGSTTQSINATSTGAYYVTVSNEFGCQATNAVPVVVNVHNPTISVYPAGPLTVCNYNQASLAVVATGTSLSFQWMDNGNDISGATNASFNTTVAGNYSCRVTDGLGCTASSNVVAVNFVAPPVVTITASGPTSICSTGSVDLTAYPSGLNYYWSNGAFTQTITVSAPGNYNVNVTDANGCFATGMPVTITVSSPLNGFTADSIERFLPDNGTVQFNSSTNGSITAYNWNFGDGGTSTVANPTHTYTNSSAPGYYSVKLSATNSEGCTDSLIANNMIRVWDEFPNSTTSFYTYSSVDVSNASFISAMNGCVVQPNGQVYFTANGGDTWTYLGLPCTCHLNGVSYVGNQDSSAIWIAGENGFTAVNYSGTPGGWITYVIPCGCDISNIYFSSPNNGYAVGTNGQVWFWNGTVWGNISPGISNSFYAVNYWGGYLWAVGYGGVIYQYQPGVGWINIVSGTVYNLYSISFGCTCVGGGYGGTGYGGAGIGVGANGTIVISNDGGSTWNNSYSGTTYDLTGAYVIDSLHMICVGQNGIVLTTSDCGVNWVPWSIGNTEDLTSVTANGCIAYITGNSGGVYTFPIDFNAAPPEFTVSNDTVCAGSYATLSIVNPKVGSAYIWSNGSAGSTLVTNVAGTYTVTEYSLCDTLVSASQTIYQSTPVATITVSGSTNLCGSETVTLTASNGVSYLWSNGAISNAIVVNDAGNYSVIVTDGSGCVAAADPVIVTATSPLNGFTADSLERFLPGNGAVQFNSNTNGNIVSYLWNFGDGNTSTLANPAHTYATANAPNFFTVSLKVTNDEGCTDSITIINMIRVWNKFTCTGTTFASYSTVDVNNVSFISSLYGCVVQPDGQVYSTYDGGTTWLSLGLPCTCSLSGVSYTGTQGNSAIWIAGENGFTAVNYSGNPGDWTTYIIPCGCDIKNIYFSNPNNGYAVGTNGQVWFWNGVLWSNISPGVPNTFYGVNFWNGYLWTVGYNGIICYYQVGIGWVAVNSGVVYDLYSIAFGCTCPGGGFSGGGYGGVGCAVGANGTISISNNAGGSWHACNSGTTYDLTGVIVIDSLHMICVGHHGIILTTSDCGLTWVQWSVGNTENLTGITANGCLAYITGESGQVYTFPVDFDAIPPAFTASADTVCAATYSTLSVTNPRIGSDYTWSNGATGTSISVNTGGEYFVTEFTSCDTLVSSSITIYGGVSTPVITTSGSTNLCGSETATLTSSSPVNNLWSTGATTDFIVVNTAGSYTVTVTGSGGCTATSDAVIVTGSSPLNGFTADSLERFLPGNGAVQFNSNTNGNIVSYLWNFGDGNTSTLANPAHTYATAIAPNFFTVSLKVTNDEGCTDSIVVINMIRIWNKFDCTPTNFVSYSSVDVHNASFISAQYGCVVQPDGHVYSTLDGGTTWLSLGLPCTCQLNGVSYTGTQGNSAIWIAGANGFTAVNYSGNPGDWTTYIIPCGCDIKNIYFSNPNNGYAVGTNGQVWFWNGVLWSNISPGVPNTFYGVNFWNGYLWTVGYNGIICYYQVGIGWVAVNSGVVYDLYSIAFGCTCPGGGFNGGGYGGVGCAVGANGTISISNNAGVSWQPSISGTTYDLTGVIVIDSLHMICVGHYGIILTTSDCGLTWQHWSVGNTDDLLSITANGCLAYITGRSGRVYTFPVNFDPIRPSFTASIDTVCATSYSTLSVTNPKVGSTYLWSNGSTSNSISVNTGGNYFVTEQTFCDSLISDSLTIVEGVEIPVITANSPTNLCGNGTVTLTSSSAAGYLWSNGATTDFIVVNSAGSYSVTVTNSSGCSATSEPVIVTNTSPLNGFSADSIERFLPGSGVVYFTSNTNGNIVSYLWDFGDGSTSTDANPVHTYSLANAPNFYTVKLVVTNEEGCSDSIIASGMIRVWNIFAHSVTAFGSYSSVDVNNASFISALHGCVVQPNGEVYSTTDGGTTWLSLGLPCTCHLNGVSYTGTQGNSAIWIAGNGGFTAVNYTGTPGGWITYMIPCGCDIKNIYFSNPNNGYAVGTNGQVWFWNGILWSNISPVVTNTFYGVNFWNGYLWTVGYNGIICRYQPGIGWIAVNSGVLYDLYAIAFGCTCPGGGFHGGGYGGVGCSVGANGTISISNDAGNSWHACNSGTTYDLTGVIVIDSLHMICVGHHGIVLTTSDCGMTWVPWSIGNTDDLLSITAHGCLAYITGRSGRVYTFPVHFDAIPPSFTVSNDTICANDYTTLSVDNPQVGSEYVWSNGSTGNSISINTAGSYFVTELTFCDTIASTQTISVVVLPLFTYFRDADQDAYGNADSSLQSCAPVAGYTTDSTDCNDSDAAVNPNAVEIVNSIDDNCDGQIDEGPCQIPTGLTHSFISTTSALVSWNPVPGVVKYKIQYGLATPNTTWYPKSTLAPSTSILITGLNPSTEYKWKVRSICPSEKTVFSPLDRFTTAALKQDNMLDPANGFSVFEVYPNPNDGHFIIDLSLGSKQNETAILQITNLIGQTIYEEKVSLTDGILWKEIDLPDYQKGVFMLRVMVNEVTFTKKLVIAE